MKTILPSTAMVLVLFVLLSTACHKDTLLEKTALIANLSGCSAEKEPSRVHICYDSLTYDNRCPKGATCGIVGHVEIKVRFFENGKAHAFKMILFDRNQHRNTQNAVSDTIIKGYTIRLDSVLPYPGVRYTTDIGPIQRLFYYQPVILA